MFQCQCQFCLKLAKGNFCSLLEPDPQKNRNLANWICHLISIFIPLVGVIIFGSDQEVAGLMRAVKRMNATGNFTWIGSDGWSARALVSDGEYKLG